MHLEICQIGLFIIISATTLHAKPTAKPKCVRLETKCDNLIWTQVENNEWIVQNRYNNESRDNGIKVWWPSLGRCVDLTKENPEHLCSNGEPALNNRMEVICKCAENAGAIEGKEGCHQYYDQGPCPRGEIVTFDEIAQKAICSKDLCAKENEKATELKDRFVPIDGICYSLESGGPCESHEYVMISSNSPDCLTFTVGVQTYADFPKLCQEEKGRKICRIEMILDDQNDTTKHIEQLKKNFNS